MRRKRASRKEELLQIKKDIEEQKNELDSKLPSIIRDTGGSIDKLPVKSKEFNKWLTSHQELNPFIGKHVTSAPEFNVNSKDMGHKLEDIDDEGLKSIRNEYNNITEEDLGESHKSNDDFDKKFIDINIIEKATRILSHKSIDDIKTLANDMMVIHHGQDDYKTEIEMDSVIENAKVLSLTSNKKNNKFLGYKIS